MMIKVRTQCFSEKFRKIFFFIIFSFLLKRSFQGIFSCFEILHGSAYIKGRCLIYVTFKKVCDLLLTLL